MEKIIVLLLALLASVGGGTYYVMNQNKPTVTKPISLESVTTNKTTSSTSGTIQSISDESIDSDVTALDKDLSSLEQSDKELTKEVEGL